MSNEVEERKGSKTHTILCALRIPIPKDSLRLCGTNVTPRKEDRSKMDSDVQRLIFKMGGSFSYDQSNNFGNSRSTKQGSVH